MAEGTTRLTPERRGTVRAVDTGDTNGRVRALAEEITTVRAQLDHLVDELDRRRHAAFDWRRQLRQHGRALAAGAVTVAAVAGLVVAYRAGWLRAGRPRASRADWLTTAGRTLAARAGRLSASRTRRRFRRG